MLLKKGCHCFVNTQIKIVELNLIDYFCVMILQCKTTNRLKNGIVALTLFFFMYVSNLKLHAQMGINSYPQLENCWQKITVEKNGTVHIIC